MSRASIALFALLPLTAFAAPPAVGYAQATGYFKKDSRPTLYQPLNLLDGRESTAWCSPTGDPLSEKLTFGFKGPVKIDEVRVYTGNGFDESTFTDFARAKKLSIKGPTGGNNFAVADQRGLQAVALNPPLEGAQFTVEVLDVFPAEDIDQPACITDIVFYSDGKPLNGSWLTPKLKYDKATAPLLGTWFAGSEGAPDKFLSFYFDGTYRYVYEPYDRPKDAKTITGEYDVSGSRMTLSVPNKGKVSAGVNREKKGSDGDVVRTLKLDGDLPEELKQTFRDVM
ncbi:MAG: discoidin domain-containing protein [Myxococcaceae bacterium]